MVFKKFAHFREPGAHFFHRLSPPLDHYVITSDGSQRGWRKTLKFGDDLKTRRTLLRHFFPEIVVGCWQPSKLVLLSLLDQQGQSFSPRPLVFLLRAGSAIFKKQRVHQRVVIARLGVERSPAKLGCL